MHGEKCVKLTSSGQDFESNPEGDSLAIGSLVLAFNVSGLTKIIKNLEMAKS